MNYLDLARKAHEAGMAALKAATPTPMVITSVDLMDRPLPGAERYVVEDGPCGFAWIKFKGNTAFGRAMKAAGLARKAYGGGLSVWVSEGGQSMARKEAYAHAYAKVLKDAGIEAYAGSRMD